MPAVSVVMPAFNAARFLDESISAVVGQSFRDWELLVADDRSEDDSAAIAARRGDDDRRIRSLVAAARGGPAAARNLALGAASGRFVAFCDSDDVWLPTKLEEQLAFMERRRAALSFTAFRRMTEDGGDVGRLIEVPDRIGYRRLLGDTVIATSTAIIDREAVGDVRMTDTYYDDFVLWLSVLKRGFAGHGLNRDLLRYRVVSGSWSRSKANSARKVWRTYREVEGLGIPRSVWSFLSYAVRGYAKYRRF